ncbi:MAG: ribonuclease T [Sulfurimonas sp.]|nr:MAG: ribonuclease T [Sulfurimonas sp.]
MMKKIVLLLVSILLGAALYAYSSHSSATANTQVSTRNALAISWQNAFCQTHQKKRECRNVKKTDFSASHFTLHGLWPQPRNNTYCKPTKKLWLNPSLYQELLRVMPAAKSGLHQHEWKKHGTCYHTTPERYFEDSIMLLAQINNSYVRDFFVRNVGNHVTIKQVRLAFDKAFGKGSGRKVTMQCNSGLITELRINLEGDISKAKTFGALLKNAPMARHSCQKGRIDRVGF